MATTKARVRYPSLKDRILANVSFEPPPKWTEELGIKGRCWIWQGTKNSRGYGHISMRRPGSRYPFPVLVHRLVICLWRQLEWHKIPVGMHLCGNKTCCNPDHLDAGTQSENLTYYHQVEKPLQAA